MLVYFYLSKKQQRRSDSSAPKVFRISNKNFPPSWGFDSLLERVITIIGRGWYTVFSYSDPIWCKFLLLLVSQSACNLWRWWIACARTRVSTIQNICRGPEKRECSGFAEYAEACIVSTCSICLLPVLGPAQDRIAVVILAAGGMPSFRGRKFCFPGFF